jgi:hypothetical protein
VDYALPFAAAFLVLCLLSAAAIFVLLRMTGALQQAAAERRRDRALQLLHTFAGASHSGADDARALLAWQPLVTAARRLFPTEFAELDRAHGSPFPFGPDQLQAAHARWSADWLAWELAHNDEYKLKAAQLEAEIAAKGSTPLTRAQLDAVEREKLDLYQRRYAEYVRISKALHALL